MTPPLVQFMSSVDALTPSDLSNVRYFVVASAPCAASVMDKIKETKMPSVVFVEGYGMTESGPVVAMSPAGSHVAGSCGQLVPNTRAKVVDIKTG